MLVASAELVHVVDGLKYAYVLTNYHTLISHMVPIVLG